MKCNCGVKNCRCYVQSRPSREETFMEVADVMSKRSTCKRKKVAALIVREGRILVTGYNGPPSGGDCVECDGESCDTAIHAEMNAIAFAAKYGVSIEGCTMYCTMSPCINCAKVIINSGIKTVVFKEKYRLSVGIEFLARFGVHVRATGVEPDAMF